MTEKKRSSNTVKNRWVPRDKDKVKYPDWEFPDYKTHRQKYCTIEELAAAFEPVTKPDDDSEN